MESQKLLKYYRKQSGLTQRFVEERLGLRSLLLKDYETSRLKLPVEMALKLAKLYGVSIGELLGEPVEISFAHRNLELLWDQSFSQQIIFDPVIRAHLEDNIDKLNEFSILELLIDDLTKAQLESFIESFVSMINTLISADGKILESELKLRNNFLHKYGSTSVSKRSSQYLNKIYLPCEIPAGFDNVPIRHFAIWFLFLIATADKELHHKEIFYIDKLSQSLYISVMNYNFIKSKFIKDCTA